MTKKIYSPHDKFFKQALSNKEVALDFFKQHLPKQIQDQINFDTLELCKETFVNVDLKSSAADVLYRMQINEKPGYIYTLSEHQSTVDAFLAFRLLCYIIEIMKLHLKQGNDTLPIVYCVVFYTGEKPYTATLDLFDLFGANKQLALATLFKPYQLIDINQIEDEELKNHIKAGLFEFLMKRARQLNLKAILEVFVRFLAAANQQNPDLDYFLVVIKYALEQGEADPEAFRKAIHKYLPIELETLAMTTAQQLEQRGHEKAFEKTLLALQLLREGKTINQVAEETGLTPAEVSKIKVTM